MALKVLVADDSPTSRRLLEAQLSVMGHTVTVVDDGRQALGAIAREHFDVIICDWVMPFITGPQVCRTLRGLKDRPYAFFLLATALDGRESFVEGMRAGADDYLFKPVDPDYLVARMTMAERVLALHRELAEEQAKLRAAYEELSRTSRIDALTGVGNRVALNEELERVQAQVDRYGHNFAVALCDVDCFKAYNDTCGHPAGDAVLERVGSTLKQGVRAADRVFRYGGEEFLVVLAECDAREGQAAADRLRRAVQRQALPHAGGPAGVVTMSVGVAAVVPSEQRSIAATVEAADRALYTAKGAGRNRVVMETDDGLTTVATAPLAVA